VHNPVLGSIALASLVDREIRVFRHGSVVIDGVLHPPVSTLSLNLSTTTGGLRLPTQSSPQGSIVTAGPDTWAGIEIDTPSALRPMRTRELILDGQLAAAFVHPRGEFNVALWDVTNPAVPKLVDRRELATRPCNDRSFLRTRSCCRTGAACGSSRSWPRRARRRSSGRSRTRRCASTAVCFTSTTSPRTGRT
jgi:hypothetical protein